MKGFDGALLLQKKLQHVVASMTFVDLYGESIRLLVNYIESRTTGVCRQL
jgi:hypothetical protein